MPCSLQTRVRRSEGTARKFIVILLCYFLWQPGTNGESLQAGLIPKRKMKGAKKTRPDDEAGQGCEWNVTEVLQECTSCANKVYARYVLHASMIIIKSNGTSRLRHDRRRILICETPG